MPMQKLLFIVGFVAAGFAIRAQDITFTNEVVSFTNLQGDLYEHVELVRGDADGLIWRKNASGGRICYTNLAPALLESLGIPTHWIRLASVRAAQEAQARARFRALLAAEGREALLRRMQSHQEASLRAYDANQAKAAQMAQWQAQQEALWNSVPYAAPAPSYYPGPYDWNAPVGWGVTPYSSWAYGWSPALGWWASTTSSSTTMHNPWN